jgi:hypothetical protein
VELAIEHKRKIVLPEHPLIRLIYFSKNRFETGISFQRIEAEEIRIYDKEKTLCDAVYYRNKIGIDIVKEALRNYTREPGKNLQKRWISAFFHADNLGRTTRDLDFLGKEIGNDASGMEDVFKEICSMHHDDCLIFLTEQLEAISGDPADNQEIH